MATAKKEAAAKVKRIKFKLPSKIGKRGAFTSQGKILDGGIVDLPEDEAQVFIEREQAFPFEGDLPADE